MKKYPVLDIIKKTNALITDSHFVGTSGKHMPMYINKDAIYPHTKEVSRIGKLFAEKVKDYDIDVVAAPALGGIVLSQWTAYHLSKIKKKNILGVYTEKTPEKDQIFTRGYDKFVKGKRVFVVEDLTTTGGSVKKVINSVKKAGGKVVAVGVMLNRDPQNINSKSIGAPFYPLAELKVEAYDPKECPLCAKNIPINTTVGHGKKYLESLKAV
ncbi:MAG: phosphoribosyltransferase family protein [Candidatus Levybacteria bacterium]|nr:phosphoribosyltransferase family protein [Candidatus Levybacteria bacterium]